MRVDLRSFLYSLAVASIAAAALWTMRADLLPVLDQPWTLAGATAFAAFAMAFGIPSPVVGVTTFERVAQVAVLLMLGPVAAISVAMLAGLLAPPFVIRERAPLRVAARALNAAGMWGLTVMAGAYAYLAAGGAVPLTELGWRDLPRLVLLGVVMQATNEALFAMFALASGKDARAAFSWRSAAFELATVPLGVLAALIWNVASPPVFVMFALLMVVLVLAIRDLAATRAALEERLHALEAVDRVGRAISLSRRLDEVVELIFEECRKLIGFSAFYLVLYDESRQELDFRIHHNEQGRQPRKRKQLGEGALGWIIETNQAVLIEDWRTTDSEVKRRAVIVGEPPMSVIGVPISYQNRVLGALSLQSFVPGTFDSDDLNLMRTFADQAAVALANAQLYAELEAYGINLERKVEERTRTLNLQKEELFQLSRSLTEANQQKEELLEELRRKSAELDRQSKEDALTGLFNRRYLEQRLTVELARAERFHHAVSVAMFDVDGFKVINDEFSHLTADEVLREIARLLRGGCRSIDVVARYGGDEFVMFFPETASYGAALACEKVRSAIERHDWSRYHPDLAVTVSVGVASGPPEYHLEPLLALADAKLYAAKRLGRNHVCR
jgi:diguanylate cyclase (GGDEF)-like protein